MEPGAVSFLQNDVNQNTDQVGFYVSDWVYASDYSQYGPLYFVQKDGSIDLTYYDQRDQLPGYKPMWTIGPSVEKWSIGLGPFSLPVVLNFYSYSNRLEMYMWDYLIYSPDQKWFGSWMSPFFASQSLDHTSSFDTNAKFDLYSGTDLVGTYVLMDFWRGVSVTTPKEYRLVSRPFSYPLGRPTPVKGTTQVTFTFDTRRSDPNPPVLSHFRIEQNGVRTDMPTGPAKIIVHVADVGAYWYRGETDASDVRLEYRQSGATAWNPLSLTKIPDQDEYAAQTGAEYVAQIAKSGPIDLRVTARDASGNTTQEEWTPAFIGNMAAEPPPTAATLVSPSGTANTAAPTYVWNAVENASYYQLWVNDSSADGRILKWFTSAEANCASGTGTCSVTPSTALAQGACRWWILTWNDSGYGPWSAPLDFTAVLNQVKPEKPR